VRRLLIGAAGAAVLLALALPPAFAQSAPADLARERADYADWLAGAPESPFAAIARLPIGSGLRLGPADADVPLDGVAEHRVAETGGRLSLAGPEGTRVLARGRPVRLGDFTLVGDGAAGRGVLTVFGGGRGRRPEYFAYDPGLVFEGTLAPPERPARVRVLAVDGIELEAVEAGSVTVRVGETRTRLRVRRIPSPGGEESELEIYFRDGSNGDGTYPAGRFVSLVPVAGGRYRLDFNRARNPFCAYSTAYPCPAPWPGNSIGAEVRAGERYLGGGLEEPPALTETK
jgi:hypothetical protein